MNMSPQFIQGFVKRAVEHGLSERAALFVLSESSYQKQADYNYIISGEKPKNSLVDSMPTPVRKTLNNVAGPIIAGISQRLGHGDPYASLKSQRAAQLPLRATPPVVQLPPQ